MGSWFRNRTDREQSEPDQTDSTVEVKAQVIADAIRAGQHAVQHAAAPQYHQQHPQPVPAAPQPQAPQPQAQQPQAKEPVEPEVSVDSDAEQADQQEPQADAPADLTAELLDQALAERRTLVQLCLYALDRARSAGVTERIEEALGTVGVTALRPDGDKFDPAHHEAGGTIDTDNAELDGTVAETEVVGFSDRGTTLRVPIVTVYTAKSPTQGAAT